MRAPASLLVTGAITTFGLLAALPATASADSSSSPAATNIVKQAASSDVRFATFNIRTARADLGTSRHWLKRVSTVARQIKAESPDVVALQELGPGRADGSTDKIGNNPRQTESLLAALKGVGAEDYKLVRITAYAKPGTDHGTQGARILYNSARIRLVTDCPETTGKLNYNDACGIDTPRLSGDSAKLTRSAAYAEFEDRSSNKNFFVISMHLDDRHSAKLSTERKYDTLRAKQVSAVYGRVSKLADGKPILFGADVNSWRTKAGSNAPYNYLVDKGFTDAVTAKAVVNNRYPTVNHFKSTLKPNAVGRQVALDVVMAKGSGLFHRYENVMKPTDPNRPSDHNMVIAELTL